MFYVCTAPRSGIFDFAWEKISRFRMRLLSRVQWQQRTADSTLKQNVQQERKFETFVILVCTVLYSWERMDNNTVYIVSVCILHCLALLYHIWIWIRPAESLLIVSISTYRISTNIIFKWINKNGYEVKYVPVVCWLA